MDMLSGFNEILPRAVTNLLILLGLSFLLNLSLRHLCALTRWQHAVAIGFLFGMTAIGTMLYAFPIAPGAIGDFRNVVVMSAGLFGGPLAALLAALITTLYRLMLGGAVIGPVVGIVAAACLGGLYHSFRIARGYPLERVHLLALGLVLALINAALPWLELAIGSGIDVSRAIHISQAILLPAVILYPAGAYLLGHVVMLELGRLQGERALARANRRLLEQSGRLRLTNRALRQEVLERQRIDEQRRAYEAQLEHQAHYDLLTGLPNRSLLMDRLLHALARSRRSGRGLGILFIDLDRFKMINDSLGHKAGDLLLQEVAGRLAGGVREEDTVARLGGDEFVVVLEELTDGEAAGQVAEKLRETFKAPFVLEGQPFTLNCSIGISLFPRDGNDVEVLLKNADSALARVKAQGRNGMQFYTPAMNLQTRERLVLENELARAVEQQALVLHYQPQVELPSGRIVGAEVLLRWQHPQLGLLPPAQFIHIAEESGLIVPIGEWVLQEACRQAVRWRDQGLPPLSLSVNLSTRQFIQSDLPGKVARALEETGLDPCRLVLEITETQLMHDVGGAIATLHQLKDMGVGLAVDDFGTGYSSLSYLKRFPLDHLKIDKAFVRDITLDPDDAAITQAIIAMAHSLRLKVVAEGVHSRAQLAFLLERNCDLLQGFLFSRPLEARVMADWLARGENLGPVCRVCRPPPSGQAFEHARPQVEQSQGQHQQQHDQPHHRPPAHQGLEGQ